MERSPDIILAVEPRTDDPGRSKSILSTQEISRAIYLKKNKYAIVAYLFFLRIEPVR